jgi:hypothetical protein
MDGELTAQEISKIEIDGRGRLIVYPKLFAGQDYAFIYRAAMDVNWPPAVDFISGTAGWSGLWFKTVGRRYASIANCNTSTETPVAATARSPWATRVK